jgi:hypothetical protein
MKTPKEILLQRHGAVEPQLNAVRQNALAALNRPALGQACREFLLSMRWHLAGMAAIWLTVLFLQFDSTSGPAAAIARNKIPAARVLLSALLQNRRELIELTGAPASGEPAVPPPRRSENQSAIGIV